MVKHLKFGVQVYNISKYASGKIKKMGEEIFTLLSITENYAQAGTLYEIIEEQ